MPEALATTKRKFHKLLDSRFGAPSPAVPRPPSREPATKRIRSGASDISPSASLRQKKPSTISVGPTREPNFAPWSHDAFVKRLYTFSPVTLWHPKPDPVNEVQWAKRGWSCVQTNTVACKGGCQQRVVVNLEPITRRRASDHDDNDNDDQDEQDEDEELEQALVEKYKELVVDGHSETCLWRQAACKDDIYRLPVVKSAVWQPQLRKHYHSLLAISTSLTTLVLKPDDLTPSPQRLIADLPPTLLALPEDQQSTEEGDPSPDMKSKALTISVCGWRGTTDSSTHLLVCDACFQRIGLWMYQPDYKPHKFADDDDAEQPDNSLDLLHLHRDHCPWRNSTSQAATGNYAGQPAYKILLDVLDRFVDEHRRRSRGAALTTVVTGSEAGSEAGVDEDGRDSLALESMPDLTRQETDKLDKERLSKLRRLRKVLGFKRKPAPAS